MSESTKFEVEINDCVSVYGLMAVLTKANHAYYQHQVKVKEIKPIPKIMNKQTATVTKLPDLSSLYVCNSKGDEQVVYNECEVDLEMFPQLREFCDVENGIDWDGIKGGSLVKLILSDNSFEFGYFYNHRCEFSLGRIALSKGVIQQYYSVDDIESIEIIKLPDGK